MPPLKEPPSKGIHLPSLTGCHLSPSAGTCSSTCTRNSGTCHIDAWICGMRQQISHERRLKYRLANTLMHIEMNKMMLKTNHTRPGSVTRENHEENHDARFRHASWALVQVSNGSFVVSESSNKQACKNRRQAFTWRCCTPLTVCTIPLRRAPLRGQSVLSGGPPPLYGSPLQNTPVQLPEETASLKICGSPDTAVAMILSRLVVRTERCSTPQTSRLHFPWV